ncbi:MAG: HAMP domain-containing protein [Bryobacterales bacterium]|nr:HAMP domain-containing protein [Bryobacterales bacterium]
MKFGRFPRLSLLQKILLSTSVSLTVLFALTGLFVQSSVVSTTTSSLNEEVNASFQAYDSLWRSRAELLKSVSLILSSMSDVRAAFSTGDQATIRDTAGELWAKVSDENAVFLVTDPRGEVIASLGGLPLATLRERVPVVASVAAQFPKQVSGFLAQQDQLYEIVLTPVYVESPGGPALINVLMAGYKVDRRVAERLKEATGGSEFLFLSGGKVMAASLSATAAAETAGQLASGTMREYAPLRAPLIGIQGEPLGELWILRSFDGVKQRLAALRVKMLVAGFFAMCAGLALTTFLARRIIGPVNELDRAAEEVGRQNYDFRVRVSSDDELGRLGATFNAMCASIRSARDELIRRERISTIGRLSSSIVHDLRNPLAAIYGGAEMMVDSELTPPQVKRLAGNIYRASRRIQELLQDLVDVSRGKTAGAELCRIRDVISAAVEAVSHTAGTQGVQIILQDTPLDIEVPMERARVERVLVNLMGNALEAMPGGGKICVSARLEEGSVRIDVADDGPGISPEIRERLFQPFVTHGKKSGLGLGLALSRQTVIDHSGEIWVESEPGKGARFSIRLPAAVAA